MTTYYLWKVGQDGGFRVDGDLKKAITMAGFAAAAGRWPVLVSDEGENPNHDILETGYRQGPRVATAQIVGEDSENIEVRVDLAPGISL